MSQVLGRSLLAKIEEQIERTAHLIARMPAGALEWAPEMENSWQTGMVLGHILDCLAGFCAVLHAAEPERLRHFHALRDLPVNQAIGAEEAAAGLAAYRDRIAEGFAVLQDCDLARTIPTIFTPAGESLLTLLLGNLEHLINHKHQLFLYLRLMGADVGSADLYRFR